MLRFLLIAAAGLGISSADSSPALLLEAASRTGMIETPLACLLDALQGPFAGRIAFDPTDSGFINATSIDNSRCVVQPLLIAWPVSEGDVSVALKASTHCALAVSVLSGGHNAACFSLTDGGLTLALSDMNKISADGVTGLVSFQTGVRFHDIYAAVADTPPPNTTTRWTPVGGGCPFVGAGGFYLGGGWSFLSRTYGLACDLLRSVTTVLADGRIMVASDSEACTADPVCRELWWASRGGGGGNFGVVTEYVVEMAAAPASILVGQLCWPPESDMQVLWSWILDSYATMPDYLQVDPGWLPIGPNGTRLFCHTVICNNGDEQACRDLLKPLLSAAPVPALDTLAMTPFLDWQLAHDRITDAQHGRLYLTNLMMPVGAVSVEVMQQVQKALLSAPSKRSLVVFHMGGGAIQRVAVNATAFPHREAQFVLQIKAIWTSSSSSSSATTRDQDGVDVDAVNMNWVTELRDSLLPRATGSYVNYMDPLLPNHAHLYYGKNLQRLREAKSLINPDNLFSFNQSIVPAEAGQKASQHVLLWVAALLAGVALVVGVVCGWLVSLLCRKKQADALADPLLGVHSR